MPKFQNKSKVRIDIVYNGRKIMVPVNGIIEGPPHLKLYKGLELYVEPVPVSQVKNILINENINKENVDNIVKTSKHIHTYGSLPSVGICILTKNKFELITDCINSILDKVKYKNTKIYIFDTGSTDQNVNEFYRKLSNEPQKIPISIHGIGPYLFSKNYNDGIFKIVDTDYCLIQNNDTVALNDYVSKLMKLAIVEKIGACGPRMLYKNGTIQHDGQYMFNHQAGFGFINPGHLNMNQDPSRVGGGRKIVDGITGAGLLVRTKIYKELGGFNQNFKDIYQDVHYNMLLRGTGYLSICDWDALIHHYDNTSRKELWSSHDEMAKLWKDSNYLFHNLIPTDGRLSNFKRKTPTFSIITIVNNKDQYQNFLDDLKKQKFNNIFEVIALPNFNNEYKSASEALNVGKDIAEGEYVIYCHQDIRVPDDWLQKIYRHVSSLNNIGFVGMAGVLYTDDNMPIKKQDAAIYLSNFNSKNEKNSDSYRKIVGSSFEVQCLDELCIIGKRSDPYRFDEVNFNHYHWYGADICLQALNDGRKNYAIDAECFHISDGISNLLNPSHKEHYINGAKLLYNKWLPKSNTFRTTTAVFNKEKKSIKFLVYDMLTIDQKVNFINEINMS